MSACAAKRVTFRALHAAPGAFVIANPWDAGSARMLAALGFQALATTSSGAAAFTLGKPDGAASKAETLANARTIVEAVGLPVSADLENGFGATPEACAATIRDAAAAGLAGGSIEDATGDPAQPIHAFALAVERVAAAAEAARTEGFVLTARAENFLHGRADLDDTIRRLQAFAQVGAEVLYAPGLTRIADIRTLCAAVDRPVNVLMAADRGLTVADLAAAGVKRVSVGGALARVAVGALLRAGRELLDTGSFGWAAAATPSAELGRLLAAGTGSPQA